MLAAVTLVVQKQLVQEGWNQSWLAAHPKREPGSAHQQLSLLVVQRHGNTPPGYWII